MGSNPASRAIFRNRSHRKGLRFRFSGASFRSRKRSSGPYFGRPTRTFEAPFENSFSSFLAFPAADVLIFCFSADAERLKLPSIARCPPRPRLFVGTTARRSGREVECTPLLRVQVRIRASGVRIPPSPPLIAEGPRFRKESGIFFCLRFTSLASPDLNSRDVTPEFWI